MKFITALFATLYSVQALACADISGHYRPYFETDDDDVVTTVEYTQYNCDSLAIGGMAIGKPHFESESKVYGLQNLFLQGQPAPVGLNCLWNSFPGVCASYLALDSAIMKTAAQATPTTDPTHGICYFKVSRLTKNSTGDLVETPQATCDDGYFGDVAPLISPKVKPLM